MTPSTLGDLAVREVPLLHVDDEVLPAVRQVIDTGVPALPVVDASENFVGIFGEREFINAIFPGYIRELHYAAFVTKATDEVLEKQVGCATAPVAKYMNTEHVDVGPDYSDAQLAETFMHHRVLIVPITDGKRVTGVVTRSDFFRALAERLPA